MNDYESTIVSHVGALQQHTLNDGYVHVKSLWYERPSHNNFSQFTLTQKYIFVHKKQFKKREKKDIWDEGTLLWCVCEYLEN